MKYYTVGLYDVKYTDYYNGQQMSVEDIIVKKGLRYATELLTDKKIEILPKGSYDKFGVLDEQHRDEAQYQQIGHHLVVLEEEFIPQNLTTEQELERYVDGFDYSKYYDIYAEIKEKTQDKKNNKNTNLKAKIKMVRGTKK